MGAGHVCWGRRVFLNVGTHAAIPSVAGLEAARPLAHMRLWSSISPPHRSSRGGYVGLDGQPPSLGSRVTVIQLASAYEPAGS